MKKNISLKKLAEIEYQKYLKQIENIVGKDETYSTQLEGVGKKLFGVKFKGVFPSDKIPKLNDLACYCILNLDKSHQAGSHWVSLVYDHEHKPKRSLFYDSFGRKHPTIIKKLNYTGNGRVIDTEDDIEQHILDQNCGARSMAFLCVYEKYGWKVAKYV